MTFETYLTKNFRSIGDDELSLYGLTKEQRMAWERFIGDFTERKPNHPQIAVIEAYYAAHPDQRPVGAMTLEEFLGNT